jgi:predicted transcriptional regulator
MQQNGWFCALQQPCFAQMKIDSVMDKNVVTMGDIVALKKWMESLLRAEFAKLLEKPKPLYYTANEAARIAGITAQAIRKRLRDPNEKHLRGIQQEGVRTTWMVSVKSFDEWIASMKSGGETAN